MSHVIIQPDGFNPLPDGELQPRQWLEAIEFIRTNLSQARYHNFRLLFADDSEVIYVSTEGVSKRVAFFTSKTAERHSSFSLTDQTDQINGSKSISVLYGSNFDIHLRIDRTSLSLSNGTTTKQKSWQLFMELALEFRLVS